MENLDERAQRVQDRLREDGDEEAAELIDELYALAYPEGEGNPTAPHVPSDPQLRAIIEKTGRRPPKRTAVHQP